jgi:hypothetical protein
LWVAGGYGSGHKIATSSDGVSWTGRASSDLAFYGGGCSTVAYGNGLWVAGGGPGEEGGYSAHLIATSSDGVEWTGSTSGDAAFTGGGCYAVAYGTNLWVAGGYGGAHKIATSSDGVSWTGSASGDLAFTGGGCNAVAYGNGLWVAGGSGIDHKIATSSDGVSWTGSASGDLVFAGNFGRCNAVAYNGTNLWVAGGNGDAHNIAYSSDGISWTGSASGDLAFAGGLCLAVAYGNGLWVAGGGGDGSANQIAYSSDGVSWTGSTSGDLAFAGSYGACRAVAYNGIAGASGLWVFGGYGAIIPPEPEPTPIVQPPVFFQQQVISSFNIFQTNFSGMGNLGEYY